MQEPEITADTVREAAKLSRIAVDDAEVERMRGQLAALLGYVSKLQEVDVDGLEGVDGLDGVEPTGHPLGQTIVERPDVVRPSTPRDMLLQSAPESDGEHFVVPTVIPQD